MKARNCPGLLCLAGLSADRRKQQGLPSKKPGAGSRWRTAARKAHAKRKGRAKPKKVIGVIEGHECQRRRPAAYFSPGQCQWNGRPRRQHRERGRHNQERRHPKPEDRIARRGLEESGFQAQRTQNCKSEKELDYYCGTGVEKPNLEYYPDPKKALKEAY